MKKNSQPEKHVVFIFIDGIGIGREEPEENPLCQNDLVVLNKILTLNAKNVIDEKNFAARKIDPILGVEGIPQSGTGQTTLLSGVNAQNMLGRHLNGFPNKELRKLLSRESIFVKLAKHGMVGNFANAFTPRLFKYLHKKRLSVTTWATLAGGRPLYTLNDLLAGRSVFQDFTNLDLQVRGFNIPIVKPGFAGKVLASLTQHQSFLLYEYFLTDVAGHAQDMELAGLVVKLLDRFLEEFLSQCDLEHITVLLTSDHGNIENLTLKTHTRNQVPLMVWGRDCKRLVSNIKTIQDVTPAIVDYLVAPN